VQSSTQRCSDATARSKLIFDDELLRRRKSIFSETRTGVCHCANVGIRDQGGPLRQLMLCALRANAQRGIRIAHGVAAGIAPARDTFYGLWRYIE
jgi:hypothetical protein